MKNIVAILIALALCVSAFAQKPKAPTVKSCFELPGYVSVQFSKRHSLPWPFRAKYQTTATYNGMRQTFPLSLTVESPLPSLHNVPTFAGHNSKASLRFFIYPAGEGLAVDFDYTVVGLTTFHASHRPVTPCK
jgi:hypothetical protein